MLKNLISSQHFQWVPPCFLVAVLSALTVNRFAPVFLNADTLMFPIMSVQNVTPFLWGQDRLANFVPLAFAPVSRPYLNLGSQLLLFAASFFLLIWLASRLVVRMSGKAVSAEGTVLAYGLGVFGSIVILSPEAWYVFALEGQPYALSYLLLACGMLLVLNSGGDAGLKISLASVALLVAVGLNPSVTVPGAAAVVGFVVLRRERTSLVRGVWLVLALALGLVIWAKLPSWVGAPRVASYVSLDLANASAHSAAAAASIIGQLHVLPLVTLLGVLLALGIFRPVAPPAWVRPVLAMMWLFVGLWILVFSCHEWVRLNANHFRYFFPFYLALLFHLMLLAYGHTARLGRFERNMIAAVCLLASAAYLARAPVPLEQYGVIAESRPLAGLATANQVQFIAGDYWRTWPVVFELLAEGKSAFGIAFRGDGNKQSALRAIDEELARRGSLKVMCLSITADKCAADVVDFSGRMWKASEEPCERRCVLLSLKPTVR